MFAEVTNETMDQLILNRHKNTLVFVWAPWCSNCKAMETYIEIAAVEIGSENIFRLEADENPGLIKRYNIIGLPALLLFSHGKLVDRKTGILNNKRIVWLYKSKERYSKDEAKANELKGFFRWLFW